MIRHTSNRQTRHLELVADGLWQALCHVTSHGRCKKCGSIGHGAGHHLIKRRYRAVRHCPENAIWLCDRCHMLAEDYPVLFLAWLEREMPEVYDWREGKLPELRNPFRQTVDILEESIEKLREALGKVTSYPRIEGEG